jgi:hypothetical protein
MRLPESLWSRIRTMDHLELWRCRHFSAINGKKPGERGDALKNGIACRCDRCACRYHT